MGPPVASGAANLEEAGRAVWVGLGGPTLPAAHAALALELARLTDTANRLADLAAGRRETWASLVYDAMGEVHLVVDKLLSEQRNTQLAIKQIHGELRAAGLLVAAPSAPAAPKDEEETPLERRRRERASRERQLG